MKNIKGIILNKYTDDTKFQKVNEFVYKDLSDGNYKITLSCELEEGEDSQYPLEDILDEYYVNCTDYFEEKVIDNKTCLSFELEGSLDDDKENYTNILAIYNLIGKHIYNKDEGYIKLIIE